MLELHNGTPYIRMVIPLIQVDMVAQQLMQGSDTLYKMGEGLAKAKKDVLNGEYLITGTYYGVATRFSNVAADYMTKVGELKALYDKLEPGMSYQIVRVEE